MITFAEVSRVGGGKNVLKVKCTMTENGTAKTGEIISVVWVN
ncbi:MAG: hypothetical protein R3E08_02460 [Thiotrichaceae bacterium]